MPVSGGWKVFKLLGDLCELPGDSIGSDFCDILAVGV
jgi:hypothetical protein